MSIKTNKKLPMFFLAFAFFIFSFSFVSGATALNEVVVLGATTNLLNAVVLGEGGAIYCELTGCQMQGDIDMGGHNIINATWVNMTRTNASEVYANTFYGSLDCSYIAGASSNLCTLVDTNTHVKADGNYLYNDSDTMYFNQSKLEIIYYNATSVDVVIGTIIGGDINSTKIFDEVSLNITGDNAQPALDIRFNFIGISDFNQLILRYKTSLDMSDNDVVVQLWNFVDSSWEDHDFYIETNVWDNPYMPIWDSAIHIGTGDDTGKVIVRIYEEDKGKLGDTHYFDFIQLSLGTGTFSSVETDPLSYHKNENINAENYNATFSYLNITENATFQDVIINGTLYGASPLKVSGGIDLLDGVYEGNGSGLTDVNASYLSGDGNATLNNNTLKGYFGIPHPDYDSGWVAFATGEFKTFNHNLGGCCYNYLVYVIANNSFGVNQINFGGNTLNDGRVAGYRWENLTTTNISVRRLADDIAAETIRIRLWSDYYS